MISQDDYSVEKKCSERKHDYDEDVARPLSNSIHDVWAVSTLPAQNEKQRKKSRNQKSEWK